MNTLAPPIDDAATPVAGTGSRRLSCGVLVMNVHAELLLCHVTGHSHWDLPKGGIEPDESPLQAALRETREETALQLDGHALLDLGRMSYRPKKDLHLFATLLPRVDPATLSCESQFSERISGLRRPEMDGYAWVPFEDVGQRCTARMAAVLQSRLNLPQVLQALLDGAVAARVN